MNRHPQAENGHGRQPLPTPLFGPPFGEDLLPAQAAGGRCSFDVTAMVDLVFMMNIFFLVSWIGAALSEIDLPAGGTAGRVIPKRRSSSRSPAGRRPPSIWANRTSAPRPIPYEVEWRLQAAAEEGKKASPPKDLRSAEGGKAGSPPRCGPRRRGRHLGKRAETQVGGN